MVLSRDFDGRCICAHAVAENLWANLVIEGIKLRKNTKRPKKCVKTTKRPILSRHFFRCLIIKPSISNFQHFSSSFHNFFSINDNIKNLQNHIYFPLLIVKILWSCHCCTFTVNVHTMYTALCIHNTPQNAS